MRKVISMGLIFLLAMLTACGSQPSTTAPTENETSNSEGSTEKIVLRMGHAVQSKNHPYNMVAEYYAERVAERTNGEVLIDIYPGGQLGGELDLLDMIRNGTLDAGVISVGVFSNSTKVLDGILFPFLFDSYDTYNKVLQTEVVQKMLTSLEDLSVKALGVNNAGMRHLGNNVRPINTIEDLAGLKIRVMESPLMLDIFNTLGASPTPMAYGELYGSLQMGVIDGHETNMVTYIDENFHEVTEYITISNLYPTANLNIMNLDKFNSLSPEHQQILVEVGQETSLWIVEQLDEIDKQSVEKLREMGSNINELENVQLFIDKLAPIYEKYSKEDPLIEEFVKTVEEIKGK